MVWLFNKMQSYIRTKLIKKEDGLNIAIVFPITFSSTLTFIIARIVSYFWPQIFFEPTPGLHVHHFTYGVFIMAAAAYLALVYSGPRAKFWIALLLGLGLGLAFDEFGMWLRLKDDDIFRHEYDGIIIVFTFILTMITLVPAIKYFRKPKNSN